MTWGYGDQCTSSHSIFIILLDGWLLHWIILPFWCIPVLQCWRMLTWLCMICNAYPSVTEINNKEPLKLRAWFSVYFLIKAWCLGRSLEQSGEDAGCAAGAGFQDQRGGGSRPTVHQGLRPGPGAFPQAAGESHTDNHTHCQAAQHEHTGIQVGRSVDMMLSYTKITQWTYCGLEYLQPLCLFCSTYFKHVIMRMKSSLLLSTFGFLFQCILLSALLVSFDVQHTHTDTYTLMPTKSQMIWLHLIEWCSAWVKPDWLLLIIISS